MTQMALGSFYADSVSMLFLFKRQPLRVAAYETILCLNIIIILQWFDVI